MPPKQTSSDAPILLRRPDGRERLELVQERFEVIHVWNNRLT